MKINFDGALLIIFVVLKLTHVIDWSWWWVLSPLWVGLAIYLGVIAVTLISVAILSVISWLFTK